MNDLISVVITTYRRNDRLVRALRSAMIQTHTDLEIIVVDDNANEKDEKEINDIINKLGDSRIKIIHNRTNIGGALSRNVGIEASSGDYVAFLDDDDQYLPQKIEKELKVLKEHDKVALVYCWEDMISKKGSLLPGNRNKYRGCCVYKAMQDCIAATSLWLCKKKALNEVGGFTDIPCKQDSFLILKLLLKGYEVDYVPEVLSMYGDDLPNRISTQGHYKRIIGEEKLRDLCRDNYFLLNKLQQEKVEYCFATRLAEHYWAVGKKKESLKCCLKLMEHPFNWMSRLCIKKMLKVIIECLT